MQRKAVPDLREEAEALVARTTAAQGIPTHLEDPVLIARVAALLAPRRPGRPEPRRTAA